ncbi:MAG: hypothetical protein J7518_18420 [Nocardioidaceae bacterium]|nr:hypothetical protein [Nocardioidaceae bacterium]
MRPELGLYVYPWDFGPAAEETLEGIRGWGVARLLIATAYHSARIRSLRGAHPAHIEPTPNVVRSSLAMARFGEVRPREASEVERARVRHLAALCRGAEVHTTAWVVGLHNSRIARTFPEVAALDAFGSRASHALCPANPASRRYLCELVAQIAASGDFDDVMVEGVGFMTSRDSQPHFISATSESAWSRRLEAICFCRACCDAMENAGLRPDEFARRVRDVLGEYWNLPWSDAELEPPDDLRSMVDLWFSNRRSIVASLCRELVDAASGVPLSVSAGGWGSDLREPDEGVDPGQVLAAGAGVNLLPYDVSPGEAASYLRDDDSRARSTTVTFTFAAAARPARSRIENELAAYQTLGVSRFALYNWSILPGSVVPWIGELAGGMS